MPASDNDCASLNSRADGGVDGERNGCWALSWPNGDRFEGEMRKGLPNGQGIHTFANGNAYKGRFRIDRFRHEGGQEVNVWTTREACGFE
ncbi:MAG: hypothetical protein F4213_15405 [Boseongicola sp. SB0677_bin_26]|nr:hypothetical protein [Boseongicola sp. SB0665_bin_10]MYG27387.1 hypothetical protein [Boseongicola sp. SB0677_bin_26]